MVLDPDLVDKIECDHPGKPDSLLCSTTSLQSDSLNFFNKTMILDLFKACDIQQ